METKHELDDLKGQRNYKGTIVTKLIGTGYSIWGIRCATPEEVDLEIEKAGTIINESIERGRTLNVTNGFSCQVAGNSPFNPEIALGNDNLPPEEK